MISSVGNLLTRVGTTKPQTIVYFLKFDVYYVQLDPFHVSHGRYAYLTTCVVYGKERRCWRTMTIQHQSTLLALWTFMLFGSTLRFRVAWCDFPFDHMRSLQRNCRCPQVKTRLVHANLNSRMPISEVGVFLTHPVIRQHKLPQDLQTRLCSSWMVPTSCSFGLSPVGPNQCQDLSEVRMAFCLRSHWVAAPTFSFLHSFTWEYARKRFILIRGLTMRRTTGAWAVSHQSQKEKKLYSFTPHSKLPQSAYKVLQVLARCMTDMGWNRRFYNVLARSTSPVVVTTEWVTLYKPETWMWTASLKSSGLPTLPSKTWLSWPLLIC